MSTVRPPAVAGQFYPDKAAELKRTVDTFLSEEATEAPCPKAIVAPHAGYVYSGSTAAKAYARVKNGAENISRVILLGPAHRVGFRGMALSGADFYSTPLGQVPIDKAAIKTIRKLPSVGNLDQAHAEEHSLEVHLPFLQRCLNAFTLVPIVVGQCQSADVARVLDALWGGPETLIIISSDLSHFLPYGEAQIKDAGTSSKILQRDSDLTGDQACGCNPINGLMQVLQDKDLDITELDLINSGDTAGDKARVVGYGVYTVDEHKENGGEQRAMFNLAQRQQLLSLARQSIASQFPKPKNFDIPGTHYHGLLREEFGCFVTLKIADRLRGCIGSLQPHQPLFADVAHNAISAAFKDKRFKPLTLEELPQVDIHISVLSRPWSIEVESREDLIQQLRPGVDGLILQDGNHRSTYLPSVWEQIQDPEKFVSELRVKAGLPRDGWSESMQVSLYTTEEFA
jgi:AmmeMemoRadiSam system protein B/AmmeMemoRadiSam system protein A